MTTQERLLPAQESRQSSFLTVGFALFSMFFGAGNLVFPLLIGQSAGNHVWFAIAGLGLTAVIVPFLGLAVMILFQANYNHFFGRIGKIPGVCILVLLQLILGPLGVIPRLITLMHATAAPYLLDISLGWFSVFAVVVIFGCSFKKDRLIQFLGSILTPILLLSLVALVFLGLIKGSSFETAKSLSIGDSFLQGMLGGYNTMDLIAAFLFASVVLPHFQTENSVDGTKQGKRSLLKKIFFTSLVAASLLMLTYIGLCLISSQMALDPACQPQQMLSAIALELLGSFGVAIAAVTILVACLTTAMTLSSIFAEYVRKDLFKEKVSGVFCLGITLFTSLLFSLLGFQEIMGFLGPILQIIYPGLILLTVLNLLHFLYGQKLVKVPVFFVFIGSFFIFLVEKFV